MPWKRPHKKTLLRLAAGTLVVTLAHPAMPAAADYFSLSPEQLLSVQIVSATKTQSVVSEAPAAVYVISQEDISRSGVTSIADALRMAPGVEVAQADSNTWAISIRGFNATLVNKLLVMIDGRTIYNPLHAGTYWELQDLPLTDIERIEVIRGPGGTLWGANAVNGVINIITKNAKDTQGTSVRGLAGSWERAAATGEYGGSSGDSLSYRTYLKASDYGPSKSPAGGNATDKWQSYHGGFRADWNKDSSNQVAFHGDVYHVDSDQMSQSFSLSAPYSLTAQETIESAGANIFGSWKHTNDDASSFSAQSYIDYTQLDEKLLGDSRVIYDLEGQYNLRPMERHEIITGVNYRLTTDQLTGSSEISFDPASSAMATYGVFAQDKITLSPERWFLTVGSKFEHNDYTGFEYEPNVRLEWLPDRTQTIWSSVSRAVRTPSRIERDLDITNVVLPPGPPIGGPNPTELVLTKNKQFESEDLIAYEAGYRKQVTPDLSVDTTAFANDYRHLGSLATGTFVPAINNGIDPIHNLLPLVEVNGMTAEVYGVELASSWEVRKNWKLSATYSYLDMFLHAPLLVGTNQETPEGKSPNHQAGLRSYWSINENWTLDTSLYYVGKLSTYNLPSYVRMDANLGWKINEGLRFNLVGQNLLKKDHQEFSASTDVNAAEIPRSVVGVLTWHF